jgi:hypothetical protein
VGTGAVHDAFPGPDTLSNAFNGLLMAVHRWRFPNRKAVDHFQPHAKLGRRSKSFRVEAHTCIVARAAESFKRHKPSPSTTEASA